VLQISEEGTMSNFVVEPIGLVHSPHRDSSRTPIQPVFAAGVEGWAEIRPELVDGLRDLEGFSHLHLLYHLHLAGEPHLLVTPFLDDRQHGVFATRSPRRPNPIGLSLVRLVGIEGNILHLEDVDLLDGTPLLDIKPHIPDFDCRTDVRCGWYETIDREKAEARGRRRDGA
jgi:tRNA-Thr(GGU) m(6)t(6)A37 methyltransferase TsaA